MNNIYKIVLALTVKCQKKPTSNLILVPEVQFDVAGSLSSKPNDSRLRFIPLLPDRVKLSAGNPWTATSGVIEC